MGLKQVALCCVGSVCSPISHCDRYIKQIIELTVSRWGLHSCFFHTISCLRVTMAMWHYETKRAPVFYLPFFINMLWHYIAGVKSCAELEENPEGNKTKKQNNPCPTILKEECTGKFSESDPGTGSVYTFVLILLTFQQFTVLRVIFLRGSNRLRRSLMCTSVQM